jgi:hypothetical protein
MQSFLEVGMLGEEGGGGVGGGEGVLGVGGEEGAEVVEALDFFEFNFFEVVGVGVVPELAEQGVVAVVLDVGLLVGHLEIEAASRPPKAKTIAAAIVKRTVPLLGIAEVKVAVLAVQPDQLLEQGNALGLPFGRVLLLHSINNNRHGELQLPNGASRRPDSPATSLLPAPTLKHTTRLPEIIVLTVPV